MPSLQFKANWKKNTSSARLWEYLQAVAGGTWYTVGPTLFNIDGPMGHVVGGAVPVAAGILFDMPGLTMGALGAWTAHHWYVDLNEPVVYKALDRYIWRRSRDYTVPPSQGVYGLRDAGDREMIPLDNGGVAYGYRSSDLPSQAAPALPVPGPTTGASTGMSDRYRRQPLSDRYRAGGVMPQMKRTRTVV